MDSSPTKEALPEKEPTPVLLAELAKRHVTAFGLVADPKLLGLKSRPPALQFIGLRSAICIHSFAQSLIYHAYAHHTAPGARDTELNQTHGSALMEPAF